MNRANSMARKKAAVDILNVVILIIKVEKEQFDAYKQEAWYRDEVLTEYGRDLMEEAFTDVHIRDYKMHLSEVNNNYVAKVKKLSANAKDFIITLPKLATMGS